MPLEVIPLTTLGWCYSVEIEQPEKDAFKLKVRGLLECQLLKTRLMVQLHNLCEDT
ncbi:MAG: hypothetical protein QXM16_01835 [Nitrososphaerota archaeon]